MQTADGIRVAQGSRGLGDVYKRPVQGRGNAARLGAVIALRGIGDPGVVPFMSDPDPGVAIEAARAVYDQYLPVGMPALAERIDGTIPSALRTERDPVSYTQLTARSKRHV